MNMSKARDMTRIALCAACLCALSQVIIPMPSGVPWTLQTFALALAAGVLGPRRGVVCVLVYLLLGALGLPVFAGLTGGIGKFAGPTGGFLIGFIPMAALCGSEKRFMPLLGVIVCHMIATAHFAIISGISPWQAFITISAPYILKDALSVVLGVMLAGKVKASLK